MKLSAHDIESLQRVQELIERSLHIRFTVQDLASHAGMSVTKLRTGFQHYRGMNIFAYTQEKRMQYAHVLLTANYLPIKEIARLCGYYYASHFNTAFKKRFGLTANQVRQQADTTPKK